MANLPFKSHITNLPAYKPPAVPLGLTRVVDLSSNENPLGPAPRAVEALRAAAETVHRYPDAGGSALKGALAAKWGLSPAHVALGNGADEWVLLLCQALVEPGDEVVMAHGSFISYVLRATQVGARLVRVPLADYVHDLEAMAAAVTERTRLVFVCNPNNPTGTAVGASDVEAFLRRVPESVPLVFDEAYYEYALASGDDFPRSVDYLRDGQPNLILLRSFSKVYGLAGLRVGYLLAQPGVVDYLERARPPFNVNRLAQVAALAALADDEHVRRSVEANEAAKAFFSRELAELGLPTLPTRANFMAVGVGRPAGEVARALLERGFVTTPLEGWGVPGWLRFSFGLPDDNRAFVAALREVMST